MGSRGYKSLWESLWGLGRGIHKGCEETQHRPCLYKWLGVGRDERGIPLVAKWAQPICLRKKASWGRLAGRTIHFSSVQSLSRVPLCDLVNGGTPGLPVHHQLPESTQTHVHWVRDAIQPSHSLLSPSPPAFNLSQHQGLFRWVSSSHQVAKVLEFQLQHQSFQWTPRNDLL